MTLNRRFALGLGTVAAAGTVLGSTAGAQAQEAPDATDKSGYPVTPEQARNRIARVYTAKTGEAGGTWSSLISLTNPDNTATPAVEAGADTVLKAQSVNKLAVAVAVLDKVDRGLISLDQPLDVTADIVLKDTDGIFGLDGAYPSKVTLGHALATLLALSDNTAVRLSGLVCPPLELNQILRDKGFVHTQVDPSTTNPNRFFLGWTTPRETHDLLRRLVAGELVSAASTTYLLNVIRSLTAFTDGVRLNLNTAERLRVATKAGWFGDDRHEAGIVFDTAGKPMITYAMFATGPFSGDAAAHKNDFGATHPGLRARQRIGRTLVDAVAKLTAPAAPTFKSQRYAAYDGG